MVWGGAPTKSAVDLLPSFIACHFELGAHAHCLNQKVLLRADVSRCIIDHRSALDIATSRLTTDLAPLLGKAHPVFAASSATTASRDLPTWLVDLVGNFEDAWSSYSAELIALLPKDRDHASDSGGRQRDIFPLPPLPLDATVLGLPCCAALLEVDLDTITRFANLTIGGLNALAGFRGVAPRIATSLTPVVLLIHLTP